MTSSLAIAAPPLLLLLGLLWSLERYAGRSGNSLIVSVTWGGLIATSLVTLLGANWVEQPQWYSYVVTPLAEELAKAGLFVVLALLGRLPGVSAGLACGLACGLGFAIWENAAYFEQAGDVGPSTWLIIMRTTGTALLHAGSTAVVGAAACAQVSKKIHYVAAVFLALAIAITVHGAWNYVLLVLVNNSPFRRALPAAGFVLLLIVLIYAVLRERWILSKEILVLWRDGMVDEKIAKAMLSRWPTRALGRIVDRQPAKLARALWALASVRVQLDLLPNPNRRRRRLESVEAQLADTVRELLEPRAERSTTSFRLLAKRVALVLSLGLVVAALNALGEVSPVPETLARRTIVVTSNAAVRPEPLATVIGRETYLLWQSGPDREHRQQMLSRIGPGRQAHHQSLGSLPPEKSDWFDIVALGHGVAVATRQQDELWIRSFDERSQTGELFFDAPEESPEPCWPWLTSDRGRTIVGWDRLHHARWLETGPLRLGVEPLELPDPFPGYDSPLQACARGLMMTDDTLYEVARPAEGARLAAVTLSELRATPLDLCPAEPHFRIHSLDKDQGQVLVLLGVRAANHNGPYRLLLARLDRSGNVVSTCRDIRILPTGEPIVVGLAGSGDDAFIAWSTPSHVLLARIPIAEGGSPARRWVLDKAPPEPGVVRVSVINDWLFVAWEGSSPKRRWSLKLLRTEIEDLP